MSNLSEVIARIETSYNCGFCVYEDRRDIKRMAKALKLAMEALKTIELNAECKIDKYGAHPIDVCPVCDAELATDDIESIFNDGNSADSNRGET